MRSKCGLDRGSSSFKADGFFTSEKRSCLELGPARDFVLFLDESINSLKVLELGPGLGFLVFKSNEFIDLVRVLRSEFRLGLGFFVFKSDEFISSLLRL